VTAAVTATNPKEQARRRREVTRLLRSMNYPVPFSVLITGS
jgi:hypothetical protein